MDLSFSPSGNVLAVVGEEKAVQLWTIAWGSPVEKKQKKEQEGKECHVPMR
jgi:hypothetical protein